MDKFTTAHTVCQAWDEVIATRQQGMEIQQRDCPWQQGPSRREFFARLAGRKACNGSHYTIGLAVGSSGVHGGSFSGNQAWWDN